MQWISQFLTRHVFVVGPPSIHIVCIFFLHDIVQGLDIELFYIKATLVTENEKKNLYPSIKLCFVLGKKQTKVECRFNISEKTVTVQTIIHHNLEETIVANTETIDTALRYAATKKQISNLKKDNKCSQSIRVRCHYTNNDQDNIWIGDNGKQFHTTLGESTGGCSCSFVNKCEEGKTK